MREEISNIAMTTVPEIITFQPTLFVYLEKIGPFIKNAPLAWKEFWQLAGGAFSPEIISGMAGLGRIDYSKIGDEAFIYQAGIMVNPPPTALPAGLKLRTIPEGTYARFLLTGPYAQLPKAYPTAFAILDREKLPIRGNDFCIERYVNNPATTPEEKLETEILIPVNAPLQK